MAKKYLPHTFYFIDKELFPAVMNGYNANKALLTSFIIPNMYIKN